MSTTNKKTETIPNAISYADRNFSKKHKPKVVIEKTEIVSPVKKTKYVEELGRTIMFTENQVVDPVGKLKTFKVSDFSMENLQQIGYDKLNATSLGRSSLSQVDKIETTLNNIANSQTE